MGLVHYLQHWLSGTGAPLHVADLVPNTHPLRQCAKGPIPSHGLLSWPPSSKVLPTVSRHGPREADGPCPSGCC